MSASMTTTRMKTPNARPRDGRSPVAQSRYSRVQRIAARLTLAAFVLSGAAGPVGAEPTNTAIGPAETTHGSGEFTINAPDHTEYTQYSPTAIVDWSVDIQQPSTHTFDNRQQEGFSLLHRSPGVRASNFYGTVTCDATCIFANEAGIYFQDGSFVDVGLMIAAGGTITNADFLTGHTTGDYQFDNLLGDVMNRGVMRGESIALLGRHVGNFGHVETPGGSFAMLAGDRILLREHDSPIVIESRLRTGDSNGVGSAFGDDVAVENAGTIDATGGDVRLAAGDMLSFAIRQTGEIRARDIALEGGDDGLVEVGGLLDASDAAAGATGGTIDVLGDYVSVVGGAVLDASGSAGGGSVHVGGERQGQGPSRTARGTYVHPDAKIRADALDAGDGGEVIVWSDDTAQIYGEISAQGGVDGGNGGFVETSGKRWLDVRGTPKVGARSGLAGDRGGDWLIDPNNIAIVSNDVICGSAPQCLDNGLSDEAIRNPNFLVSGPVLRPTVDDSKISATAIENALQQGVNVTILTQTIAEVQGDQVGNISVLADIRPKEEQAPGPGTEATLALLASQNIAVDADIGVQRRIGATATAPSDLMLNLFMLSADQNQAQAAAPADQIPNNFLGAITIDGDLATEGGDVNLQGFGVTVGPSGSITTNGGALDVQSIVGDIALRGAIDTSTSVVSDVNGEPLLGGRITMRSEVVRRPTSGESGSPTIPVGGNVNVLADVTSGGGDIDLTAEGGNLVVGGPTANATIASGGGGITLRALEQTLAPVTSADTSETVGGAITIANTGKVRSDGNFIDVGVADLVTFLPGAKTITVRGEIDSGQQDSTEAMANAGGPVLFNTVGTGAAVILGGDGTPATIRTNGGRFESFGDGTFEMRGGEIDTTQAAGTRAADFVSGASIRIQHDEGVSILASATDATRLAAETQITILSGQGGGIGDLLFDPTTPVSLSTDDIVLIAGDGEAPDGVGTQARVDLGATVLAGFTNAASPATFTLQQDADLSTDQVLPTLLPHLADLDRVTLSAWDGFIRITEPNLLQQTGLDLDLNAGFGLTVPGPAAPPPATPPLASLDISIVRNFVLDATLAGWLDNAAEVLTIGAGSDPDNANIPSLTIGDGVNGLTLRTGESLTLQAGQRGVGDLAFAGPAPGSIVLGAPAITLQAGDGDAAGASGVRSSGLDAAQFEMAPTIATPQPAFTLRQDAAIDDTVIPTTGQFTNGVAGVAYTLRTDAVGSGITLDPGGADQVAGSDLRLFANGTIDLTALPDGYLDVFALQLGGIGDFQYTGVLNDKFTLNAPFKSLILRAALGGEGGVLSFESGLVIEADDIRLVAGDGVGGGGTGTRAGGVIDLTPIDGGVGPIFRQDASTGPSQFVFRQDEQITRGALPDLQLNFAGNAPDKLAIRSDDESIQITDFASLPIFQAKSQVVLSAPAIELNRGDGLPLVMDALFGDGSGGPLTDIQQRATFISWSATDTTGITSNDAEVKPGDFVKLTDFDAPLPDDDFVSPPPAFRFDAVIIKAPESIQLTQDGSIGAGNLIALTQLGNTDAAGDPNFYQLTSNFGSITIQPGDVANAELRLILSGVDDSAGNRTVAFSDPTVAGFDLQSLLVENPFGWRVENAATTADQPLALRIDAVDTLDLLAALSDAGDLTFNNVTLKARAMALQAGDDPSHPRRESESPTDPLPVVDTTGLDLVFEDRSGEDLGTRLQIFQLGGFTDGTVDPGFSRIIDASQITRIPDAMDPLDTLLDQMQLTASMSDILIDDFGTLLPNGDYVPLFPAHSVALVAGSGIATGGMIRLAQTDGNDLNLSVKPDIANPGLFTNVYDDLTIFARTVELSAVPSNGSTADTSIRAEGINLFFLGPVLSIDDTGGLVATSPESISFDQNGGFVEVDGDCTFGCLPDPFQLGPTLSQQVDYSITSRQNQIVVNDDMVIKVWGSNLILDGNGGAGYDVDFMINTTRDIDLFLTSLTVGPAPDPSSRILLRSDPVDFFQNLVIVTSATQTYNGAVDIDGDIDLTGNVVAFDFTIDEASGAATSNLVVNVVSQAVFAGDIGNLGVPNSPTDTRLDTLRVNFNPDVAAFGVAQFGSSTGGNDTTVRADTIQFFAVSDLADPDATIVPRSPTTSTIYKINGDLLFNADTFQMGVGEKVGVQGDLDIQVGTSATVGDLAALNIRVGGDPVLANTPTIALQRRAPGTYLALDGAPEPDSGLDFVANTIDFAGHIVLTGSGANPIFGLADPAAAPAFMNPYSVLSAQQSGQPLTPASFAWTIANALPDLHPDGASRDDISEIFIPISLVAIPPAWDPDAWMPWERSELTNLFVYARRLDRRELLSQLDGAGLIDDVGRDLQAWDGRPLPVAGERLDGRQAKLAVDLFEQIFGADGGNVEYLRRILQRALDEYTRNTGARRVVGFELRRYVKNRPSSLYQAYQLLEDLDTLFAYHRGLGLTPGEYRPIQARWLAAIRPDGITTQELAEAVQPSRYVRGSDVLDIFGE